MHKVVSMAMLSLFLLLTACGSNESNVEKGNREGYLYWGNGTEPQELDPHITTGVPESYIQSALFEPLVDRDPDTLAPVPATAASWDISEDGKTYTFHIRPDARWSNGDKVTAFDFEWSYWRAMQPKLGNQYAYMYYPIRNASQYIKGELTDFSRVGVHALDEHTLQIELANPTPFFLGLLAHHSYYPVHRKNIETFGSPWKRGSHWTRPGNLVSNGAFQLAEWKLFKVITVEKNPYFYDASSVKINGVHFIPTENITTEERMFRAGQLHFTNDIPADKFNYYKQNHSDLLMNEPYLGTYFYRFNTSVKPFDDMRVRRALAMTVDRERIVKHVTKQGQIPAYTITPPGTAGYYIKSPLHYDPKQARKLLAEAGYPNGKGFPTFEILYNTSENHRKIAVAIQQMWKKELNINVTLRNEDWKVYLDSEKRGDYQVSRAAWIGDYVDPNTFLDLWIKNGGNNRTRWYSDRYDQLILEQAPRAKDTESRYQIMAEAEQILLNELPVIPIYTYTNKHLVEPSLKGVSPNLLDVPFFKYMSLEPQKSFRIRDN